MTPYTIARITNILKGKLLFSDSENQEITSLLTDSRKLANPRTCLFFALQSKRNDGHKYIKELSSKGVRNFVIAENTEEYQIEGNNYIIVKDTLLALQQLAAYHREQFDIPVIGITGSNGKTIVKDWICQLLSPDKNIVSSPKSYNSQIGVPLSVWQMSKENELAVFEAGVSEPNEMIRLQSIIKPTIGIFTNIGQAHDENFLTRSQKIAEKLHLFTHVETLIYSADAADIHSMISSFEAFKNVNRFTWGTKDDVSVKVLSIEKKNNETNLQILYQSGTFNYTIPFVDSASIENSLHCCALLCYLDYSPAIIAERMQKLSPIAMRLELKEGINNCAIINDSYSSDLNSLGIALDFLQHQQRHAKKTLILSDILQSGKLESQLYEEVSEMLVQKGIDSLIGIGEAISRQSKIFPMQKLFYKTTDAFISDFPLSSLNNETILLKGARIFEFERISRLLQRKSHETILEINLNSIEHNLNFFRSLLNSRTKIMAMVKAFSYGTGSAEIAHMLQFNNVDYLTVAYADEGVDLRNAGITLPILVMNPEEQAFNMILKYNLEPEIYSLRLLKTFIEEINTFYRGDKEIAIHIEVDTGMHRLGMNFIDLKEAIQILKNNPYIKLKSVFSHLAASEDPAMDDFTLQQISLFEEISDYAKAELGENILCHILNTAGISRFPNAQFDMVRLGIGLYGISSDPDTQPHLQNVSILKTKISQIRDIESGESVGYNRNWVAQKPSLIAVIPIGYADGLNRRLGNGVGSVLVNGMHAPIIGNICMDMCMIDVTLIDCKETDEVIIFGNSNLVQNMADHMGTIPYEVFTGIPQRVKRIYYHE